MTFEDSAGTSTLGSGTGGLKSGTPSTDQNKQCGTINCTLKLSTYTETISIDSDIEPEQEGSNSITENGNVDENQHVAEVPGEPADVSEEIAPMDMDGPSEISTLQDGEANTTLC